MALFFRGLPAINSGNYKTFVLALANDLKTVKVGNHNQPSNEVISSINLMNSEDTVLFSV